MKEKQAIIKIVAKDFVFLIIFDKKTANID